MNLTLERWLTLAFFGLTLVFVSVVSIILYAQLKEAIIERTQDQLLSINILKKRLVEQHASMHPDKTALFFGSRATRELAGPAHEYRQELEAIVTERTGMGATGESYLVHEEGNMLTVSRFLPETLPGSIQVDTRGFRAARAGQEGVGMYHDYRGVPILGAYRPVRLAGKVAVLLTEIDVSEAMQPVIALRNRFLWLSFGLVLVSGWASVWLAQQLAQPIRVLQQDISWLARGVLPESTVRSSPVKEINLISASLNGLIQALHRTVDFAQTVGQGNLSATYQRLGEQDQLGNALLAMQHQLATLRAQQEQVTRETKKLLVSTQEAERERIARDIHDGLGPLLTTAKLKISSAASANTDHREAIQLLDEVIAEMRRISRNLMPALLRDFGVGEAIKQLLKEAEKSAPLQVRYVNDLLGPPLPQEIGIALYRIVQEAVNNTLKHTQATQITVSLTEFDDQVVLYYKDNGPGMTVQSEEGDGRGLKNIRERISILSGTVRIYSEQGTIIEAEIPLA